MWVRSGLGVALVALLTSCSHIVVLHDPLGAAEHNDLGVSYERDGETELAAREYRRALRVDPHFARARVNLGNLEAAANRWTEAEVHYRRALQDAADDPDALNNLAYALLRRGRNLAEAEALAARAVRSGGPRESLYRETLADIRRARGIPAN